MRTIIAGSRSINDYQEVERAVALARIEAGINPTTIISGAAYGIDRLGEEYARQHDLPVEIYRAEWEKYGKSAGFMRNKVMANTAEALIAIHDGISSGTAHMVKEAKKRNLKVFVLVVPPTDQYKTSLF